MARLYNRFWVTATVVLSVVFSVLFLLVVRERYGLERSILLTAVGVVVIWAVYFGRASIFSRTPDNQE